MHRDQFADTLCSSGACIHSSFHRPHVTDDTNSNQSAADMRFFPEAPLQQP